GAESNQDLARRGVPPVDELDLALVGRELRLGTRDRAIATEDAREPVRHRDRSDGQLGDTKMARHTCSPCSGEDASAGARAAATAAAARSPLGTLGCPSPLRASCALVEVSTTEDGTRCRGSCTPVDRGRAARERQTHPIAPRRRCHYPSSGNGGWRGWEAVLHTASQHIVFRGSLTSLDPEPRAGARCSGLRSVSARAAARFAGARLAAWCPR